MTTTSEVQSRRGILHLVKWCVLPTQPSELFVILRGLRDDELLLAMTKLKGVVGRISWAEYGRRQGYFAFDVAVTSGAGKLSVDFSAPAVPIHELPQYKMS